MSVHMHYEIIGRNIVECRKELGLTQEQLAERAGICQQFLSKIERGKGVPSLETVMSLCIAMQVQSDRLLTHGAVPDEDKSCRLKSSELPFTDLSEYLLTFEDNSMLIRIRPEDLPIVDLELPDTELDA